MSITKILEAKEVDAAEKLEAVAEVVAGAREKYGNADVEIDDPQVNTTHGSMPFSMLEADSKVELLRNEALEIKARAIEAVRQNPGIVLNRKIEELLATNPYFTNLGTEVTFDYL